MSRRGRESIVDPKRTGQRNMLSQALRARKTNRRSTLAPYERCKGQYRALYRLQKRRGRRRAELRKRVLALKEQASGLSEKTALLFEETGGDHSQEQKKRFLSNVTRLLKNVERVQEVCDDLDGVSKKEPWQEARQGLAELGTQLVDELDSHEQTTMSWMKIQHNINRTTVGSGIDKLPGRIAFSPFTMHDQPFDHIDARNAASVSKTSR